MYGAGGQHGARGVLSQAGCILLLCILVALQLLFGCKEHGGTVNMEPCTVAVVSQDVWVAKIKNKYFGNRAIGRADMGLAQPGTLIRLQGWKVVTR